MSLPQFPKPGTVLSRDEALDAILTSIAMEEVALSHIINAEGEKIQHVIRSAKQNKADICDVMKVNDSAAALLEQVNDMQITLKNKLRLALKYLPKPQDPPCQEPTPPRPTPKPCSCQKPRPPYPQPKPPRPKPCSCKRPKPCSCRAQDQDYFTYFDTYYSKTCDFCNYPHNKKF